MTRKKSSSFWAFGIVEVKGDLQVSEVYFDKNKPWAFTGVDWKQFRKDREMILEDISSQTKLGCEFYFDGKKLAMKRRKSTKRGKTSFVSLGIGNSKIMKNHR